MFDVIIMDLNGHSNNVKYLSKKLPHAKILKWTDHLATIKRATDQVTTRYFWVISSCCNYTDFDFTWEPVPWENHQIHCWPSETQQFGDTFLIPTANWREQKDNIVRLEEYKDVNFNHTPVPRLPWQKVIYSNDSLLEGIENTLCETPYVLFQHDSATSIAQDEPWLWREQPIVSLTKNNSVSLIPRAAHGSLTTQIYDYKYLKKCNNNIVPLDIVFIDNGESNAEHTYDHLCKVASLSWINRIHRSSGVNGRVAAYRAAAEKSTTPWFFAVFAKLWIDEKFNWSWQPDYWQEPKHYIFHAHNPVNGLVYGHQAMIAYNKKLVLENTAPGLDFTLDQAHEVVPIMSGIAMYDETPWVAWRTAFRECIKLKDSLPNVENEWRLSQWLTIDRTTEKWSMKGAEDAIEYYEAVNGNFSELKKSYDWAWLASYAFMKRNLSPSQ